MAKFVEKSHKTWPLPDLKVLVEDGAKKYGEKTVFLDRKTPGQTAPREAVSFNRLLEEMNAMGTALLAKGMKGKKIAVIGENRYAWILSYLAVVNGVGVIVPLDKELPAGEVATLLERSRAAMVIYSQSQEKKVLQAASDLESIEYLVNMDGKESNWRNLSIHSILEEGKKLVEQGNRDYIDAKIDNQILAVLLFTSGTTGTAKGVMLSHRNITANVENMMKRMGLEAEDRLLSVLPIHHTYELSCEVLPTIYKGSTMVFCDGLKYIQKNLKEEDITLMLGVPLIFETFHKKIFAKMRMEGKEETLRRGLRLSARLQKLHIDISRKLFKEVYANLGDKIKVFISGASAIDPQVIRDFRAMGINMFQGYGLTENAPIVAVNADYCSRPESVGPAMPGTEIRIDDPDEEGIGEILCRSESVMLGYYEDPEETAKVLLPDGWLRTGDYGYVDKDGFVYITGRKKNVIITKNGKNIFPEELEYQLNKSDCIKESMVWGREDEKTGETFITAEIVVDKEAVQGMSEEDIYALIKDAVEAVNHKTPPYKRIKKFNVREAEFEKTTTQKIMRHKVDISE